MSFLKKAQQQVAHTSKLPSLGNQDLRQLQDVITSEKSFIQSNTRAATDFKKNAEAIKAWSAEEGADLNDVAGKVSLLYDHYAASQNRLNSHLATVRLHFKSIRTREEALANLKSRKRSLGADIEKVERKLAKMGPENKELMKVTAQLKEMRAEMQGLHIEVMNEDAAIGDFKRRTVKEALGIKSGALLEMAEKLTILAEVSKLMLDEIPLQPTRPGMPRAEYYGFAKTESLLQEATRSIADVGFNPTGPSAGIPRFGDMTLADTTANGSYANNPDNEVYYDSAAHGVVGDADPDAGYSPSTNRMLSNDQDVTRTPIYAQHASRSQWAQEGADNAADHHIPDASTNEWAQSSYERGDTSTNSAAAAAAMAATAGADLNAVPGHDTRNQPDGGFLMQNSQSYNGSAGGLASAAGHQHQFGSNRNSADYQGAQGNASGAPPAVRAASTEGDHQTDAAYDGYTAGGSGSQAQHDGVGGNGGGGDSGRLGAPLLPPLRTATPLDGSAGAPAQPAMMASPTLDDSAYFQSIGSTRAMQEAVRQPLSPHQNTNRASSYGALGAAIPRPSSTTGEGKKVTAAAFRRGFSRNPSSQANVSIPASGTGHSIYDDAQQQQVWSSNPLPQPPIMSSSTPVPPGAYLSTGGTPEDGSEHSSVPPLHIQKRLSGGAQNPLSAAAAAGTPREMQGRRYSGELEGVGGSEYPAPPYGGAPGEGLVNPYDQQGQRAASSRYAEYAAPPPPGYGYA